ncbi:hypothetical protein J2Y48_001780 [Mycoplana sp. BE70]|nr:hypothetical protein [Mycoplana sp. BE70]
MATAVKAAADGGGAAASNGAPVPHGSIRDRRVVIEDDR